MTSPENSPIEYPDEAGYPDGTGTLTEDQTTLIAEVDDEHALDLDFYLVDDEENGVYEAVSGDTELGGLTYSVASPSRLVLLAVSVFPEYRNQGVATELTRRVLDSVRAKGKTATILCPIVRAFIDRNPEYADLVDATRPGVPARPAKG